MVLPCYKAEMVQHAQKILLHTMPFSGPSPLQAKALLGAEQRYSHIGREALGILHGLQTFHHYCFAREVSKITDHKPLVAIFKKDVATLSQ